MYKNPYKKQLPKLLTKPQRELQANCFNILTKMIFNRGYIKGYGSKTDRLMSHDHSPIENIENKFTSVLNINGLIIREGLVYIITDKATTIINPEEINVS